MLTFSRRAVLSAAAAVLLLGAARGPAGASETVPVVATFSILGDFVRVVGGARVSVRTLVGPDGDAHVYNPSPADARAVAEARAVFVNGLGFEGWIERLVKASGTRASLVVATRGISPRVMEDADGHGHDHGAKDPHAWQSVANAKVYVANVRDGLVAADPDGAPVYQANAAAYLAELDRLDAEVRAAIGRVPPAERRVLTSHDAFGYFAAAYGVTFLAPQGVSTEAEATAKDVARLIRLIRKEKIKAVFVETITDPRLADRIARETGVALGGEIYSDALSPSTGPAATYIDMVRHNVKLLTAAMAGS
ncbi:metal ABC transporter substrate-binding protein [Prosthecomicrobium sp. N25]|uniref:metal ABC transporter substrate-binding protein n=1 Tax=Prosthecomicrobium sp. N25 TaxID=3129254 RepID=UPI0030789130